MAVTQVTHNHPEGINGAEATAVAVYLARTGSSLDEIRYYMLKKYYPIDFTLDSLRDSYRFNETCQDTVPQALEVFLNPQDLRTLLGMPSPSAATVIRWLQLPVISPKRTMAYLPTSEIKYSLF